ncbi:hypothetical protein [Stenotrophomonas maltophilia]|uniref:hypothetical protein n=1 Tax=Stenotrophomonas maltophilia TaxID=40324 RepID=UPI0039C1F8CF
MTTRKFANLLIASAPLLCAGCVAPNEIITSHYATRSHAEEDGALARGWLPEKMPASAANIIEVHSIDSNEMWIRFSYAGEDSKFFVRSCVRSRSMSFPDSRRTKQSAPWWPQDLSGDAPHEFYACNAMRHAGNEISAGVVVLPIQREIYYWVRNR